MRANPSKHASLHVASVGCISFKLTAMIVKKLKAPYSKMDGCPGRECPRVKGLGVAFRFKRGLLGVVAAVGLAALPLSSASAAELRIYPVRLLLTPDRTVAAVTVQNSGHEPALFQLSVMAWRQTDGQERFEATRELLANPAMMRLEPGAEQIVRVGLRAGRGPVERSYRIFLKEVPVRETAPAGVVRTLLELSVPVFVPVEKPSVALAWAVGLEGQNARLDIRNAGSAHVQLTNLTLKRQSGEVVGAQRMSLYVLPGATMQASVPLSSAVRPGETLRIEAASDQGPLQGEAAPGAATGAAAPRR